MRGPDHLGTVLVCAFISASCLPRFQCGKFCNKNPQYHRPLFSASAELFHPDPATVPDAKLGFSNAPPRKCRARSHLVVTLGLFLFAAAPLFAPSDWDQ